MMNRLLRYLFLILCLGGVLFAFNRSLPKPMTERELEFNEWLERVKNNHSIDTLSFEVALTRPEGAQKLSVTSSPEKQNLEHIERVLNIAQESRIMALSNRAPHGDYIFSISSRRSQATQEGLQDQSSAREFTASFSQKEMAQNVPLANLVKLMELFSQESR
jgi:hypothetical protein